MVTKPGETDHHFLLMIPDLKGCADSALPICLIRPGEWLTCCCETPSAAWDSCNATLATTAAAASAAATPAAAAAAAAAAVCGWIDATGR